jgi:serine/threonine protein kinase
MPPDSYPKQFGKYLLTKRIAVGGMAEVFKSKLIGAMGFEKTLAVKRILPEYSTDEEFVQMFVDEARICSSLHHNNIVQVFDFGEVNNQYYLAMEFIDGCNLKNLFFRILKLNKRLPRDLVYYIIMKTASALDYAHKVKMEGQTSSLQLVHRDVSPQNILLSKNGDVKITDFGIAKAAIKVTQTQPGKIQGKYSYMSPEQALGKQLNHQSDIFSLGIVFYELLSAKKVYGSSETVKRYNEATKANIPRIGTILTDLPSQVESLITQMLSRDPKDRPKDCTEVVDVLTEFLSSGSDEVLSSQLAELVQELFPEETIPAAPEKSAGLSERSHIKVALRTPSLSDSIQKMLPDNESKWLFWLKKGSVFLVVIALLGSAYWAYDSSKKTKTEQTKKPEVIDQTIPDQPVQQIPVEQATNETPLQHALKDSDLQLSQLDDEIHMIQTELDKTKTAEKPKKVAAEDDEPIGETAEKPVKAVPPPGCPSSMVKIEGGDFFIGSNDPERNELVEPSARKISIQKFCIDKYEYPNQKNVTPIKNVTWQEAKDMCQRDGKRLCTETEWERTCKGPWSIVINQQYPYGLNWRDNTCNIKNFNSLTDDRKGDVSDAGGYPECVSQEGVYDLAGNLQEWTASKGHLNSDEPKNVIKGGSYATPKFQSRCSYFSEEAPSLKQADIGFRCCKDVN